MRVFLLRSLFVMLGLGFIASTAAGQARIISGKVTEAGSGHAIVGARVQASLSGSMAGAAVTGDNGEYRITGLNAGTYTVSATRIGYQMSRMSVTVGAGATDANFSLTTIPSQLQQVITTASRAPEKVLDAPASVSVVTAAQINERPSVNVADHVVGLPGIDVARGGIMQSNIVSRGFNNIFSGAMMTLTDNRFAFVPSLRVNIPYLTPTTNEDIERIEVVLGPAAALYGPNTPSGVMAVITKSPFSSQGTTLTVDGGNQSLLRGSLRTAGTVGEKFGYKLTYEGFKAKEWPEFQHDTLEKKARETNLNRQGGEARVDFRPTPSSEIIANYGRSKAGSAVEPTGLGPGQVKDWLSQTYQLRGRVNRLFGQIFLNKSDAGGTYLLRTVKPTTHCPDVTDPACIIDQSTQFAAQGQHGIDWGTRQRFLYGVDYQHTTPKTGGTINGRNENDDEISEVGGYLHSVTQLSPLFELTAAARVDHHSRLEKSNFSPRVALVFKPAENQNLRLTYNRAFSTPSTNNLFLDLVAGSVGGLFNVRALGVPEGGFSFKRDCTGGIGNLCMRVGAFPGTTSAMTTAVAAPYYPFAIGAAASALIAAGIPASVVNYMASLRPTPAQVGTQLRVLNTENSTFSDRLPTDLNDVHRLLPEIHNVIEGGYKGILGDRLQLQLDLWHENRKNFVGPLIVETPNVFLDRATLATYLTQQLTPVVGAATAAVIAANTAAALAGVSGSTTLKGVPLGVVNFQESLSSGSDVVLTYRNFGNLNVWGSDLGGTLLLDGGWSVEGTYSYVNKDFFPRSEVGGVQDIALNAPANKGTLALQFHDQPRGIGAEVRGRHVASFPVYSFINGTIDTYNLLDAQFSLRPESWKGVMWSINATNLLDSKHREFVGGGRLGRLVMTRLQYAF